MHVDKSNYDHFMSVMAFGMDMVQYNQDCFGSSDVRMKMSGYSQMSTVVGAIIHAGYSPAKVVDPFLGQICTRCNERSTCGHLELKHSIDENFSIDVEVPYFAWFEEWFNENGQTVATLSEKLD